MSHRFEDLFTTPRVARMSPAGVALAVGTAILLGVLAPRPALAAGGDLGVAIVDLRRAFAETRDGKSTLKRLKKEFDKRQAELDRSQKELLAWKDDIAKRLPLMTDETKREKQEEFQKRLQELEGTYKKLQEEMAKKEEKLSKPILERLQEALINIAEEDKFDLIMQVGPGIAWSRKSLDITDQLIRRYERMSKKKKK